MAKQKAKSKRGLKKGFFEVEAPITAVKINLYGANVEDLDGRIVKLDLTKSLRGKSLDLKMIVRNDSGKLKGEPKSLNLVMSYVRRNMRRGADYVEDSFEIECRDAVARIKPLMITRKRVSRVVRRALRDACRRYIEANVKVRNKKELFEDIMTSKLQKGLSGKLKKIYPLAFCEIRSFEVLRDREITKVKEEEKVEVDKEEEKEVVGDKIENVEKDKGENGEVKLEKKKVGEKGEKDSKGTVKKGE